MPEVVLDPPRKSTPSHRRKSRVFIDPQTEKVKTKGAGGRPRALHSRTLVRVVLALVVALAVFVGLVFIGLLFGGADCNQGECNWFGEFIDDTAPLYLVLSLIVGLLVGWAVLSAMRRRR